MPTSSRTTTAVIILGILFFLFGFVTWVNGPLMSYLKMACELEGPVLIFLVTFAFYIAYFVTALPMSWIMRRTGLRNGMMVGLLIMAAGALLFVPAAGTRAYPLFLAGLFTIGTGLSMLQTASNPYITVVGPIESAAARISIMGICNKLGGIVAPFILGALILVNADQLKAELLTVDGDARSALLDARARLVVVPYAVLGAALLLAAVLIRLSPLPPLQEEEESTNARSSSVFKHPQLLLGVAALFVYVWAEVLAGDSIPVYAERLGTPLDVAKTLTSVTLMAMLVGYVVGIALIPRFLSQRWALALSAAVACVTVAGVLMADVTATARFPLLDLGSFEVRWTELPVTVLLVALLGLGNALMWPAIWPLAVDGIGSALKTGSALLIMAILGGALALPAWTAMSAGAMADASLSVEAKAAATQQAYWLLLPFYLFIGWYALQGSRLRASSDR